MTDKEKIRMFRKDKWFAPLPPDSARGYGEASWIKWIDKCGVWMTPERLADTLAMDTKPANSHAWLNRAAALYRWAVRAPHTRWILKLQIRLALEKSRTADLSDTFPKH